MGTQRLESMLAAVVLAAASQTAAGWISGDGQMDRAWNPQYVWTGDFNGDGRTDLVALQEPDAAYGQRRYVMFFSNGAAGWTSTDGPMPRDWNPQYVWTGDFNGDGRTDLVSLQDPDPGFGLKRYVIFFSDGAGGFVAADGPVPGNQTWNPRYVWPGDFSSDGRTDLVTLQDAIPGFGQRRALLLTSVRLGEWAPISAPLPAPLTPLNWNPQRVWTGDFDGDGKTDLVSLQDSDSGYGQRRYIVFFATGGFPWRSADGLMDRPWNPQHVWTGDFNGDGRADLISLQDPDASFGQKRLVSFMADGGGGWIAGDGQMPRNWNPQYVWTGDFDGDGKTDFASLQDPDAGFGQKRYVLFLATGASGDGVMPRAWNPQRVWTGDFNGDGKTDLVSLQDSDLSFGQKRYVIFFSD